MTVKIINETAATSQETSPLPGSNDASTASPSAPGRAGLLMAGVVLMAALSASAITGFVPILNYPGRRRDETTAEAATLGIECDPQLLQEVSELFERGASEFFEDGMRSAFSQGLLSILRRKGNLALKAIAEYLSSGVANPDVVSEALQRLADINDSLTLAQRWAILQRMLQDTSPKVRDGALLGFAALDDSRARPLLLQVRESEKLPELRSLIDLVVEQLSARDASFAAHG